MPSILLKFPLKYIIFPRAPLCQNMWFSVLFSIFINACNRKIYVELFEVEGEQLKKIILTFDARPTTWFSSLK